MKPKMTIPFALPRLRPHRICSSFLCQALLTANFQQLLLALPLALLKARGSISTDPAAM